MRKIYKEKLDEHERRKDFLMRNRSLVESYPVLYQYFMKYKTEVEKTDALYRSIHSFPKHTGSKYKTSARKKLSHTIWHKVIPFLTEVALVLDDAQLLILTDITQKSLDYLSTPKFVQLTETLIQRTEPLLPNHPSSILSEQELQKCKEQWENFLSLIYLPNRIKANSGTTNREIITRLQILNQYPKKLLKLLVPLFDKNPELEKKYITTCVPIKTRRSRYAVLRQVLDTKTGQSIANATVHFPEQNQTRHTSPTGRLWIRKFPMGTHKLIISHPNYNDLETYISLFNYERGKSGKIYLTPKEVVPQPGNDKARKNGAKSIKEERT